MENVKEWINRIQIHLIGEIRDNCAEAIVKWVMTDFFPKCMIKLILRIKKYIKINQHLDTF